MFVSKSGMHLYEFYREKERMFKDNYQSILVDNNSTEHNFHEFRVSIKRIKAIFRLLELISADFRYDKQIKPFKDVFRTAGKIREAQVNLRTLNNYNFNPSNIAKYVLFVNIQIDKSKFKLKEKLYTLGKGDLKTRRKAVKICCQELKKKHFFSYSINFIKERIELIRNLIAESNDDLTIHDIRIYLKEISAVSALLRKINLNGFDSELLESMKKAEDEIGNWHDKVVLIESIKRFIEYPGHKKKTLTTYTEIIEQIEAENEKFLEEVENLVYSTMNAIEQSLIRASDNL